MPHKKWLHFAGGLGGNGFDRGVLDGLDTKLSNFELEAITTRAATGEIQ